MQKFPRKVALDTGFFLAVLSSKDPDHDACLRGLNSLPDLTIFVTTESCLAELAWLIPNDRRLREQISSLVNLLGLQIVCLDRLGLDRVYELQSKYSDLPMDFADATIVVACERLDIKHVFTLDRRDFSVYRPNHTRTFHLLP